MNEGLELKHNKITSEIVHDYSQNVSLLSTVAKNKKIFTRREIQGAENAQKLQQSLGWPSTTTFKHYIQNNLIRNCGITLGDVNRSLIVYGTPIPLLKGKIKSGEVSMATKNKGQLQNRR